jgi:hypothetical protein
MYSVEQEFAQQKGEKGRGLVTNTADKLQATTQPRLNVNTEYPIFSCRHCSTTYEKWKAKMENNEKKSRILRSSPFRNQFDASIKGNQRKTEN